MRDCTACPDCDQPLTKSVLDHYPYGYDHGAPIQLRKITRHACACGYYEIEFPKMGPLHDAIAQALNVLHVKRDDLEFFFTNGPKGVVDGEWGVCVSSCQTPVP